MNHAMRSRLSIIAILLIIVVIAAIRTEENAVAVHAPPITLAKGGWPKFQGDSKNTGRGGICMARGVKIWEFTLPYQLNNGPAIGPDGTVYIGCGVPNPDTIGGRLYALDGKTGKKKWEFDPGDAVLCTPAIGSDGTVFFGCRNRQFYALEGATGRVKWKFTAHGENYSSPALSVDGVVYFGSSGGFLYALDAATGDWKWEFQAGIGISSSPAIGSDGTLYVCSVEPNYGNGNLFAIDAQGKLKWRCATASMMLDSPILGSNDTIFVSSMDASLGRQNRLYAIDARTGKQLWQFKPKRAHWVDTTWDETAIGKEERVYFFSQGTLYALAPQTGKSVWQFSDGFVLENLITSSDGTVYVGDTHGQFWILSGKTGKPKKRIAMKDGAVVVVGSNGLQYGFGNNNKIWCMR
jgi:outer membrane protein assembly factor BamB